MKIALATIAALAVLATASTAQAAQRYASPKGNDVFCTQAEPCSLENAVNGAESFDEVIVMQGAYTLNEPLIPAAGVDHIYVHGDPGGPRPSISGEFKGSLISLAGAGDRMDHVEITNTSNTPYGAYCGEGGRVERVRLTAKGPFARALFQGFNCMVRDSVLIAEGENSSALHSLGFDDLQIAVARNVTAIATGTESAGILSRFVTSKLSTASHLLDARNVIVAGGVDIRAFSEPDGPGNVIVANSNFDTVKADPGTTITDAGGNQTAAPLFVNAAAGDYREAAGSPTIDTGVVDQLGALDFAGNPRVLGAAPDIGAYETALPAGEIQSLSVSPKSFRALNGGGAIFSSVKKAKAPVGATVAYSLSRSAATYFFVERKTVGRRVKGKCRKQTRANRTKRKCPLFKQLKSTFAHSGSAGQNSFKFSGRIGGRALKPGGYRLVGATSAASARAAFRIVK
jgi:hypothetical protein